MDDLRFAYARFNRLAAMTHHNEDSIIEFTSLVRWIAICVHEAKLCFSSLRGSMVLKRHLEADPADNAKWNKWFSVMNISDQTLTKARNKISAHIVSETLARALELPHVADKVGAIEIGQLQGRYRFPIATEVLLHSLILEPGVLPQGRWAADQPYASNEFFENEKNALGDIFELLGNAHAATIALFGLCLHAYADSRNIATQPHTVGRWSGTSPIDIEDEQ